MKLRKFMLIFPKIKNLLVFSLRRTVCFIFLWLPIRMLFGKVETGILYSWSLCRQTYALTPINVCWEYWIYKFNKKYMEFQFELSLSISLCILYIFITTVVINTCKEIGTSCWVVIISMLLNFEETKSK